MSTSINTAFVKQFEREVHESYQRLGSKLRGAVRSISNVQGSSIRVRAFGWSRDLTRAFWRIEQDLPLPFALLSVNMEFKIND